MVREVLDPSPREEVYPQRAGGTWQPGLGAGMWLGLSRANNTRKHPKT